MPDQYEPMHPMDYPMPPPGQPNFSAPMNNYAGTIITMTNPDDELYKLELTLRNKILDRDGNPVVSGEPLMNEDGINAVLGLVQSIVNRVTIMSNLKDQEIRTLMDVLSDALARDLMMNRVKYGIKIGVSRDRIYSSALMSAFITMKRAYEEGDRRFWKGSQQEITTRVESNQRQKGLFSKIGQGLWGK
jgi:hypothetical protein